MTTTENNQPLCIRATHAPWREILRQRWSGRRNRALVLLSPDGVHHVLGFTERSPALPVAGATAPSLLGRYESAFHVHLGEQSGMRPAALPTRHGTEPVDVRVLWWVHDPAQVVLTRTTDGWDTVCGDLDRHLRQLEERHATEGTSFGQPDRDIAGGHQSRRTAGRHRNGTRHLHHRPRSTETLRWSGVVTSLLAIVCFVCAIAPRRRSGRRHSTAGPGYFEHITPGMGIDSLNRAFEHAAHDPTGPLLLSLQGTSEIIRAKYRWVETGAVLLMAALPQFAVSLHA